MTAGDGNVIRGRISKMSDCPDLMQYAKMQYRFVNKLRDPYGGSE